MHIRQPSLFLVVTLMAAVLSTFVLAAVEITAAAPRCNGTPNLIPVWTSPPQFVKRVPNGKLYTAGNGSDSFSILHLWGTPYAMGYAQGQLLSSEIRNLSSIMLDYFEFEMKERLPWLPKNIADLLVKYGAPYLLELTFNWTKPFTPQRYFDEMQGLADGAGVNISVIHQYNMVPEIIRAACTIVGANGASTPRGGIQHLRGLDWGVHCPIKDYSQITVYHSSPVVPQHATVGWAGLVGALTGISETPIGLGMKVWINESIWDDRVIGEPWMFLLRDVLFTANMTDALSTMQRANRTCAIHVGVGDATTNTFRGVTMDALKFNVYNDSSINYPQHPIIKNVMYWDRYIQPSHNYCLSDLLQLYYGRLDAATLALNISGIAQTGDYHSVSFDYERMIGYVANSRRTSCNDGDLFAYNRQYTRVDFGALFKESKN